MSKVSIVTGANKGIGFAIVRGLCKQLGGTVILTARNEERGLEAVKKLKDEGLTATFEQLDITDVESVDRFVEIIKTKYGGIDILCNNAGIAYKTASTDPLLEKATVTGNTNFISTVRITHALIPLMRENGRICQVSSRAGLLGKNFPDANNSARKRFLDEDVTEEELMALYDSYIKAVENDDYSVFKKDAAYSMSKVFLTGHTKVLGRILAKDKRGIIIGACCPGFVDTDMTSHKGYLTIDQGAETPLHVCQLPSGSPNGEFYAEKRLFNWEQQSMRM